MTWYLTEEPHEFEITAAPLLQAKLIASALFCRLSGFPISVLLIDISLQLGAIEAMPIPLLVLALINPEQLVP